MTGGTRKKEKKNGEVSDVAKAFPGPEGGRIMKNRKKTRYNARKAKQEERLDTRNAFGIRDPTPYEAVLRIRKDGIYGKKQAQEQA